MTDKPAFGDRQDRKRVSIPAAIATVGYLLLAPFNLAVFYTPEGMRKATAWVAVLIAAGLVYAAVAFGVRLAVRVRAGERRAITGLRAGAAVAVLNVGLLLLIWPGYWAWDELHLSAALSSGMEGWGDVGVGPLWQGLLTYVYQAVGVALVGSVQGIILIQVATVAAVTGWIVGEISSQLARPGFAWLVAVPAVFLPTLLNNLYPLRLTEYGYIALAVLFALYLMITQPHRFTSPGRAVFVIACFSGVLMMWRGEGIVFLGAPVVAAVALGFFRRGTIRPLVRVVTAGAGVLVISAMYLVNAAGSSPLYQVTALLSPLSRIVQIEPEDNRERELFDQIDRVVDIEVLQRSPYDYEIPAFWQPGLIRDGFEGNLKEFRSASLELFLRHPRMFLNNRLANFLATNGMDGPLAQVQNAGGFLDPPNPTVVQSRAVFEELNPVATPINGPIRDAVVRWMLTIDALGAKTAVTPFVWNAIPALCALGFLGVLSLWRRAWLMACLPAMVLGSAGIVFLTAPASYFMYYFPAYLIGWFALAIAITHAVDARGTVNILTRARQVASASGAARTRT